MTVYDQFRIQKAYARRAGKSTKDMVIPTAYCECGKVISANKKKCLECRGELPCDYGGKHTQANCNCDPYEYS